MMAATLSDSSRSLRKSAAVFSLVVPVTVLVIQHAFPSEWSFMWALAFSIFLCCKFLTLIRVPFAFSLIDGLKYTLLWPGLNASSFLKDDASAGMPSSWEWMKGVISISCGVFFFWGNSLFELDPLVHAWLGMVGVVMMLHFGIFQCLSCLWRSLGVCSPPLMIQPLRSSSLAEFWGRRWNTAFRDFANEFFFKPLSKSVSAHAAMMVAFLFSGVVHDLVISLPARGGYGLPTLYFLIQAAGMSVERSRLGRGFGLMRGWRGWCFTVLILIAPVPLLFHGPFLSQIILPMMRDLGALP